MRPGAWLRVEVIEAHGLSAEMAIRFEKAFELSDDTLMRMRAAHDLAVVRARVG